MLTLPLHPHPASTLSRQHRAWVALYALDAGARPRAQVLRENDVTEADLVEFEESWLALRCRTLSAAG
ncbi:hypothetical protein [Hymenobacter sp. B81]|uniref:hypothetical protein n=1 Tax=Hymenobacter sp. B81 TaxID=3344878 RepID=UPI0037DD6950